MRLTTVRPVYDHPGPFVSLHLDVSRDTEDARQQLDARWTTTRHELERHDLTVDLIERIEELLRQPNGLAGPVRRTLVVADGDVLLDHAQAGTSPWPEAVEVGPLPDLSGWLSMADGQFPFLLVRADRLGADLEFYVAGNAGVAAETSSVDGSDLHVQKVPQGDWAQDKYQQRSENQWRENAELAVGAIEELIAGRGVRLIVLSGDVRARADLADLLAGLGDGARPDGPAIVQTESGGGRAAGSSDEALWAEISRILGDMEARNIDDLSQRLTRGLAVAEGVVTGVEAVADALAKGAVQSVVLDLPDAHAVTLSAADHPGLALPEAAMDAGALPADQVLLAAAALTDAEVAVLPAEVPLPQGFALSSGVAALLRWDERTPERDTTV